MKLEELIDIADKAYPDGKVREAFDAHQAYLRNDDPLRVQEHAVGDSLAVFVAIEITETFDPDISTADQIAEALRVMTTASEELNSVVEALEEAEYDTETD